MRKLIVLLTVVVSGIVAVPAAQADSPHFLKASATTNTSGALVCSFKEAGLGNVPTADITCSATATVVYQCFNNGGNHPKAGNKETVQADVSASGTFPVRNGQTTGSITVPPPGPGDFSCPNGQTLFLQSVEYQNITISGQGASADVGSVGPVTLHIPA
ncbi:MAG TPA: hypothetical protein VE777_19355 [Gaiellales bacterium]|jgi:hypothetical protein|nr:hypothetical protein [Gaiellales bacterium]